MILELAIFDIQAGQQSAFEAAFARAAEVISEASGYVAHELQRCIETDTRFMLLVRWQSLEHHLQGFRQSPAFTEWRAILSPYFASLPVVEHYTVPDAAVGDATLDVLFHKAHSHNAWTSRQVAEPQLRNLYDTLKWAPTSFNGQPARIVFCRSLTSREKLAACAMPGNRAKILGAPVTAIIAYDPRFFLRLPVLAAGRASLSAAIELYGANTAVAHEHAFRNGSLQGAYLILAARALGLDCGPMSGFDNARVDAEFFATSGFRSNFICALGYADPSGMHARAARLEFEEACECI